MRSLTLPRPHLHLPSRLRRGVSALWNETDGGGGWPCCCDDEPGSTSTRGSSRGLTVLSGCAACPGGASEWYSLTFNGFDNRDCTSCESLDGTYLLQWVPSTNCRWRYTFPADACQAVCGADGMIGYSTIELWIQTFTPTWLVRLSASSGPHTIEWQNNGPNLVDPGTGTGCFYQGYKVRQNNRVLCTSPSGGTNRELCRATGGGAFANLTCTINAVASP